MRVLRDAREMILTDSAGLFLETRATQPACASAARHEERRRSLQPLGRRRLGSDSKTLTATPFPWNWPRDRLRETGRIDDAAAGVRCGAWERGGVAGGGEGA